MIRYSQVHRGALWILGEYANSKSDLDNIMNRIRAGLGELPLVEMENRRQSGENLENEAEHSTPAQLVTSDGTYATQSAFNTNTNSK